MALLTISGDAASRWEDVAQSAARTLNFEFVGEARLAQWIAEEFGDAAIPVRMWLPAAAAVLARLAKDHHLAIGVEASDCLFPAMEPVLRARVAAPVEHRVGNLMLDERLEKPQALTRLRELDAQAKRLRKARSGKSAIAAGVFDITVNAAHGSAAEMLAAAVRSLGASEFPGAAADELQFRACLELAKHGIVPAARAPVAKVKFGHPSEEVFANLLDFYRIEWLHEPRTFALQWDKTGQVTKAFTPDFYLPEFDLYIELTTMKQSLVSHKNRKVAMLRAIYPHVNIQVFYQKDFQDLVFRHGLRMAG